MKITIGGNTFTGKARTFKSKDTEHRQGRQMIAIKLDDGQVIYGGASFFVRV